MPFVRRPVRLTGGDIPERPSASRRSQKKRRRGLGLIEVRVPASSEQQARLEQERAARKQAKKISKARRNVDPDSAGGGHQAAQLKKPKVSSPNQGKPKKKRREKSSTTGSVRNGAPPRSRRRFTRKVRCEGCGGDIEVVRAGPVPRICSSCRSKSITCCQSCWASQVYDICALCGGNKFTKFDLAILTRQQLITLARGLGNALSVAQKEIGSGMLRTRGAQTYRSQPARRASSGVDPDVAGETLVALVITLDRKVRETLKKFNAVVEQRRQQGAS